MNTLAKRHNVYHRELKRVGAASRYPHVMRILAEDLAFQIQYILGNNNALDDKRKAETAWGCYRKAVKSGRLLGLEYERYAKAKMQFRILLRNSYYNEVEGSDEKSKRYVYALSKAPMPAWFDPDKVIGWLEEMITASCIIWFAVKAYQEETKTQ